MALPFDNSFETLRLYVETMKLNAKRTHARDEKVRAVLVVEWLNLFFETGLMYLRSAVMRAETDTPTPVTNEDRTKLLDDVDELRRIWSCSLNELITMIDPQEDEEEMP